MGNSIKILKTIPYSEFYMWDVKRMSKKTLSYNYPVVYLNQILSKANVQWEKIVDGKEYPILGVRAQGKGVYINRIAKGEELTMRKYQKSIPNSLFYCKVRTVKGQWGIVYPQYANSYGSSNMTYLNINHNEINLEYFELLLKIKRITDNWDKNAIGADGRHFPLKTLLNLQIPLPPLKEQNRIVANYNKKIQLANKQEEKAKQLEKEIDNYLFNELGIERLEEKENVKGLQFVGFKNLDRWDILTKDLRILNGLSNCRFELKRIGEVYNFPSRSWKKKDYKKSTFSYIELGAIDPITGITELKEIEVQNAPSRATQQVKLGDFLIGTTRPYLKRFVIIKPEYVGNICSSGFSIIEPNTNYNLFYLKEFLMSYFGLEQLKNRMTGGTYPAITNNELKEILVPLPPIEIQNKIANHISKLKQQIKELQEQAKENREMAIQEFENEIFIKN